MDEIKNYGVCTFCEHEITTELVDGMCPVCLKIYEHENRVYDQAADEFKASEEEALKNAFANSPNYKENCVLADAKENSMIIALQARRSEALKMAYYTCHKLGHFSTGEYKPDYETPEERQARKIREFLSNIEEAKVLARINMEFILEG